MQVAFGRLLGILRLGQPGFLSQLTIYDCRNDENSSASLLPWVRR
jgi:hypothetical protein